MFVYSFRILLYGAKFNLVYQPWVFLYQCWASLGSATASYCSFIMKLGKPKKEKIMNFISNTRYRLHCFMNEYIQSETNTKLFRWVNSVKPIHYEKIQNLPIRKCSQYAKYDDIKSFHCVVDTWFFSVVCACSSRSKE